MTDQAKRTANMRKWRKRNRKKYNAYQRKNMKRRREQIAKLLKTEPDYSQMNQGIRKTVKLLRSWGFNTTDSGDGETRQFECDQAWPYVHIITNPSTLVLDAKRLARKLKALGIALEPMNADNSAPTVETSYSPTHGIASITLWNVKDTMLP